MDTAQLIVIDGPSASGTADPASGEADADALGLADPEIDCEVRRAFFRTRCGIRSRPTRWRRPAALALARANHAAKPSASTRLARSASP